MLVGLLASSGDIAAALKGIDAMSCAGLKPNAVSYTPIIDALGKRGRLREALSVLDDMRKAGVTPNVVSYTALLGSGLALVIPDPILTLTLTLIRTLTLTLTLILHGLRRGVSCIWRHRGRLEAFRGNDTHTRSIRVSLGHIRESLTTHTILIHDLNIVTLTGISPTEATFATLAPLLASKGGDGDGSNKLDILMSQIPREGATLAMYNAIMAGWGKLARLDKEPPTNPNP